jgi:hypothetical protein
VRRIPPSKIDNASPLLFTAIDGRHKPTGACRHTVEGELSGSAAGLAICQYDTGEGFYLFYCDRDWNVITDTWHETLEDAKAQAEFEYEGAGATWRTVDGS